jgi:hypothetical protein
MCGSSKQQETQQQQSTATQSYTPSAQERELIDARAKAELGLIPQQTKLQETGMDLVQKLLAGGTDLPEFFQGLTISPEMATSLSQKAVRDIMPQFQSSGILDSGVSASVAGRSAADIERQVAEFNIGSKFNMLNQALGGQAQVQAPIAAGSQLLANQLARTGTTTTTGFQSGTGTVVNQANPWAWLNPAIGAVGTGIGVWGALGRR